MSMLCVMLSKRKLIKGLIIRMDEILRRRSGERQSLRYDVVIAGGGPAGIAAALESARSGAKTALLERYGVLGGNMTMGCVGPLLGSIAKGTIVQEIENELGVIFGRSIDVEYAKYVFVRMLTQAGVDIYYQTLLTDVDVRDETIVSATAVGKCGAYDFHAKIYIDATGDGDLAYYAGCPYQIGRAGDALVQPASLMFVISGIDPAQKLTCEHEEHHTVMSNGRDYLQLCKDACASGELPPSVNIVRLYLMPNPGERMVNATQSNGVDPFRAEDLQQAELELRSQIELVMKFLRKNVPGFEQVQIKAGANTLGVRESRRILGDYVLTDTDIISGRTFQDVAVHYANFPIDIHNPSGAGQSETEGCPYGARPYDIPFACMRPLGVNNLFTAGRCISGTHRSHASYRVMRICMAMGQAAGSAAAFAAVNGLGTRQVDYSEVQRRLTEKGVQLFD